MQISTGLHSPCLLPKIYFFSKFFSVSLLFLPFLGSLLQLVCNLSALINFPLSHMQVLHVLHFHHALTRLLFYVVLKGLP